MTLRKQARDLAVDTYTKALASDAIKQAIDGVAEVVLARVEWRRANAHLLALEAERMIVLLRSAPGVIWFRKARVKTWGRRARKHGARAYAADKLLAKECGIDCG